MLFDVEMILSLNHQPKNCSETALKLVRRKGISLETQTLTNEAKINVL